MKKKFLIFLLIFAIVLVIFLAFNGHIIKFIDKYIVYSMYENKYDNIDKIEKSLTYNNETDVIEENSIKINDLNIVMSDIEYTEENKLSFELKFSNSNTLNDIGYILRVYNEEYSLGDRYSGKVSITPKDWIYYQRTVLARIFGESEDALSNNVIYTQMDNQEELLEDGSLVHKISFNLPEEFIIKDTLNIALYDINYQNFGDSNFYQVNEDLVEINYTINNI